jgi:hypothetical protein
MKYFEEVDFIPHIPEDLIDDLQTIETYENIFPDPSYAHTFANYRAPFELKRFLKEYFPYDIAVRYQVIKKQLPVHVDVDIKGNKFNYIITAGGDNVKTRWWDDVKNPTNVLHEVTAKPRTWHSLKIDVPHDITEISSPRVAVVVRRFDKD